MEWKYSVIYTDKDGELQAFQSLHHDYTTAKREAENKPDFDKLHTIFERHTTPQTTTLEIYMFQ